MNHFIKRTAAIASIAGAGLGLTATTAGAAPVTQEGLLNVNLTGATVQLPIALAANVCDVNVAVLVDELSDGSSPCDASSESGAVVEAQDSGPFTQRGLVNVNITDLVVQAPIGIAANVCDVNVGVLVGTLLDEAADCDAASTPDAITTITG